MRIRSVVTLASSIALALAVLPFGAAAAQEQPQDRSELENACPEGDVPESGFTDTTGNPHEHAIECAAWWEITRGGPAGRPESQYGPEIQVRRDQMATFVARMIDESDGEPLDEWDGENRFEDVSDDNPHMENINRLAEAGIVHGRSETEYAPAVLVRRDQMASFIARAIEHVTGVNRASDEDHFEDVDEANPHRENINGLYEEGVVAGRAPGVYAPASTVRRDAMAAFVMRGLDLHVEEGDATPPDPADEEEEEEEPEEPSDCPPGWPEQLPCEPPGA